MRKKLFTNFMWIMLLGLLLPGNINSQILKHAYTFNDGTANDTVGTLNGTLVGDSISIANGMCTVKGATTSTHGYIRLKAYDLAINTYSAITLEAYLQAASGKNTSYSMLAYFGNNLGGNKCFWIQPTRGGSTQSRVETNDGSATRTAYINGTELDDGKLHHVVAILSNKSLRYYLDGLLADEITTGSNYVSSLDTVIAQIFKGPNAWADPNYKVSLDEFNIYDGELSPEAIKSHASAYLDFTSDSRLASLSPSPVIVFSPYIKSYYIPRKAVTTSVNIEATAHNSGAVVTGDGNIVVTGKIDTVEIKVVAEDKSDSTIYTVYLMEEQNSNCYSPLYDPNAIENLVADPECTNLDFWNGWGTRSIYINGDSAYCGISCAKLEASDRGCRGALDISGFKWKANTTYRLHVMVKTISGSIGFLAKGTANIFGFGVDTKGEWMLVDTMFTTGANPGTNFYSFNTCDYGSNCLVAYIDNYELYEVSNNATLNDLTVSVGEFNKDFSPSDTVYTVILPVGTDTVFVTPVPTIDSAYVVSVDTVIMQNEEGTSEILVTSFDSSSTKTYTIHFVYETVFIPIVGQEYNIIQKVSGMILADDNGGAKVVTPWETSAAQRLEIVESNVAGEYFILAKNKTTFLYRLTTNTWSMGFKSDTTGLTANCRWKFVKGNEDTIYIQNPATGKYVASDQITSGSGVFHDKAIDNPRGVWQIVEVPEVFIPETGKAYSVVQKVSQLALGNSSGAKVLTTNVNNVAQRIEFVESKVAGIFYIMANNKTSFMYRLTADTWSMGFTADTTGLSANCGWKIVLGNADTIYIQNPVSGKYVASDQATSGSSLYHDKAIDNPRGVWQITVLGASNDATLSDVKVADVSITGFAAATLTYNVGLPEGTTAVPVVTATTTDANANAVITAATAIPGSTTVVVTAEDGTTVITYTISFAIEVGINNTTIGSIEVYPNPVENVMYLKNVKDSKVTIFTLEGKSITTLKVVEDNCELEVSGLTRGMYILEVNQNNQVVRYNFVKK